MRIGTDRTRTGTMRAGIGVPLVLLTGGLLVGCVGEGAPPSTVASTTQATGRADAAPDTSEKPGEGPDVRATVGPLLLGSPRYWSIGETADGTTVVSVDGCPDDQACPAFAVLQGDAIAAGFDAARAYTKDGTRCPGGLEPQPTDDEAKVTPVVIGGVDGTLSEFQVGCADRTGVVQMTVPQVQWYLPEAPDGAVLVVDRWSFDGLSTRVAGAGWALQGS